VFRIVALVDPLVACVGMQKAHYTVVDLLVPLLILANFASAFESSLQHALADFSYINSLSFPDNITDIKK